MSDLKIRNATVDDAEALLKIYGYYVEKSAITFECTTSLPTSWEFNTFAEE